MKRILINATQSEELRVAIVDVATQGLLDLLVERQSYKTKTGNIYMGTITAIEPSLDACFVNFGSERHGFLPFKEIVQHYFATDPNKQGRIAPKDALKEGQKILIQVEKEERGNKGAALTTFISLAGSYVVLMPDNPRAGGISRRVEGGERDELRESLSTLPIPDNMGLIVRTAGVGKAATELEWDLNALLKQWEAIQTASAERTPPFLVHQESDIVIRAIRDYLREDISEILVDDRPLFERIKGYLEQIRPEFVERLKLYTSPIPLFNRYQIEHQIEAAHDREVRLPAGGSIVIGHTEALVAIDVNSGQATKGKDIEQTAFETNIEAARMIACQLRLRDIGGLIVIDFIDMPSMRHRREVENELRNALKLDKARTQVGTISPRFGLLEMSRQRLRHSLAEATRTICTRCDGWGSIRSIESLALSILRMIEEDAIRPGTAQVQAQLPVDIATFIINEKRDLVAAIEKSQEVQILIIPNAKLESPHYHIRRLSESEMSSKKTQPSYRLVAAEEVAPLYKRGTPIKPSEEKPAVQDVYSASASTQQAKKPAPSLVKRLISSLFGAEEEEKASVAAPKATTPPAGTSSGNRHSHDRPPRHHDRSGSRPPRSPRPPSSRERTPRPPASATPGSNERPPRTGGRPNTRNNQQQKRTISPRPQKSEQAAVSPTAPTVLSDPPDYLKSSIPDTDLENYYQESSRFVDKKSSKAPAANATTTAVTPSVATTNAAAETPKHHVEVSNKPGTPTAGLQISVSINRDLLAETNQPKAVSNSKPEALAKPFENFSQTVPPAALSPASAPTIEPKPDWVPHKIVSPAGNKPAEDK